MREAVVTLDALDDGAVLAPERYGALRAFEGDGVALAALVELTREPFDPRRAPPEQPVRVLDTTHARDGVVCFPPPPVAAASVGSPRRRVQAGDVLLSRLRPYLRQVAWLDPGVFEPGVEVVCSPEFYVLRARDDHSLAFLVPWLLSAPVQDALAAAQEGGHHPRVPERVVEALRVPTERLALRGEVSAQVTAAVGDVRRGVLALGTV